MRAFDLDVWQRIGGDILLAAPYFFGWFFTILSGFGMSKTPKDSEFDTTAGLLFAGGICMVLSHMITAGVIK